MLTSNVFVDVYLFTAIDAEYQVALAQKLMAEENFNNSRASLDSFLSQIESTNQKLADVLKREEAAKKDAEAIPIQIKELQSKIEASGSLLTSEAA